MTRRFRIILIIAVVMLVSVMSTAIGLTAAIWDSASGGSSEYGPVVDAVDWNTWKKYFTYENVLDNNDNVIGRAVVGYTGTNLGDVIFPVAGTGEVAITTIKNTVFDGATVKDLPVTIYISPTISKIEAGAFSNLPNLQKVVFAANGVAVTVEAYAFAGCSELTEVVIGDGTTVTFDENAFRGCYSLESVTGKSAAQVSDMK